ncbi:MAG TPA: hypothetical protein VF892_16270, partial [Pseudonocardiaceae bacterium]
MAPIVKTVTHTAVPVASTVTSVAAHTVNTVTTTVAPVTTAITSITTGLTTTVVHTIVPIVQPAVSVTTPVLQPLLAPTPTETWPPAETRTDTPTPATAATSAGVGVSPAQPATARQPFMRQPNATPADRIFVPVRHSSSDGSISPGGAGSLPDGGGPIADITDTNSFGGGGAGPGWPVSGITGPISGTVPDLLL